MQNCSDCILAGDIRSLFALFEVVDAGMLLQSQLAPSDILKVFEEYLAIRLQVYPDSTTKPNTIS